MNLFSRCGGDDMVSIVPRRILIDTNVLLFALSPLPGSDATGAKVRHALRQGLNAKAFLERSRAEDAVLFVSSISVGEMLEGAREEDVQSVYSVVTSMFPTLPFDNASAFVAAALARKLHRMDLQDIPDKSKLRNDLYIMATGIQNACSEFYTTDNALLKQARRLEIPMQVYPLPEVESR